ncbi:Alpha/Beta hydrolase protein [Fusarium flagelliforme]|uniref:Alpha/Beta hydrolase protein n=1 Tax=Fusarium flagelliforme TaxID=2675880 RepID=UPI001E8E9F5F|nr:Alpha/Beta hydrolase protein [Fusarium flagelliforme]KAH7193997.1 Alpha/Beta hydrolase protein [Fusarium flagelliforme]
MTLSSLTKKTLEVSRGFTYTYYVSPNKPEKPTIILFHGCPDSAQLWSGLINNYLVPNGYGVVALDCLGYAGTSKPTDLEAYAWQHMTADAIEILDAEKVGKVISLGHDWGSAMCQRLYNFYPDRVIGLVMINVAYMPPGGTFDLEATNKATKEKYGYGIYDAAFGDPYTWLDNWVSPGGMRKFISEGRTQPTLPFTTPEHKLDFMERYAKEGAFAAMSCWYKAFAANVQSMSDKNISEDAKTVNVPALFWGGEQDFVCRPAALQDSIDAGLLPDVKSVVRQGGHWALLERPKEFGEDVLQWLESTTFAN